MSEIKKLIERLCPEGVEYKKIDSLFETFSGMTGVSDKWKETGNCQFIDYLNVYNNMRVDVNNLPYATVKNPQQNTLQKGDILLTCASETPDECAMSSVIRDDINEGIFLDDHLFAIRLKGEHKDIVNTAFLNYYMHSSAFRIQVCKKVRGVTRFYITGKPFMSLEIPVPPIEVQSKIVEILDNFTELEGELEGELEARKKQYEYYRNQLLTFDKDKGARFERLKDVFEMRNGYTPSKNNSSFWDDGIIPWFRMEDIRENGRLLSDSIQHIAPSAIKGKGVFKANSIILATSATIGEHALISVEHLSNQRFTNIYPKKNFLEIIDMKFIFYYMFIIDEWCKQHTQQGSFASVDMNALYNLLVPIPPLSEQKRIVSILDRFEALTTDLQSGLPAEIEARRKQYEYYREKLLTFKRKTA